MPCSGTNVNALQPSAKALLRSHDQEICLHAIGSHMALIPAAMHDAVTRQFVLLAFYLSWLPIDVAEILLSEMVTARVARHTGVRITGQLGLRPGWETWGPYCGLVVDWCKRLGVEVVKAFVAFNLSDQQLRWVGGRFEHKDSGNVNVGRVVVNLGGGAGRALSEAWKEKAAREDANLPPTQRDKQLQAGRAAAALTRKRKIENASGLLGYQDTMRS
ncbi:hypothetical protein HaLaN_04533 [Haematococcus lacustris]|uniref:Uncharacterized protein n=1 Tax=Haematococcus lacustris TaxID=44745 RepID=A0A699YRJ1_HAELA|nr:hypothetical protein HaLaN_04533 [Haematococcus lacustris]